MGEVTNLAVCKVYIAKFVGYVKKIRTDDADSLIKEKQKREKKHKKEKKDKEKKEGKEKRDKETSKDKHKEKHKGKRDKDRDKEKSRTSEDKKAACVLPNTEDKNNGNAESKFVQDLARRIRDEEEATQSQTVGKISFPCGVTENNISCPVPQTSHRKDDEKRINTHRNFPTAKRSENEVRQLSSCTEQRGAEVMVKPVEKKDQGKIKEVQEKNHHTNSVTKSDKPLYNEGIKKGEPKYITDRSSKEEKTEVINKNGQEKPNFVEGGPRFKERDHVTVDIRNLRVPELSRGSVKNLTTEGIIGKRKDLETNGMLYENGSRPNKIQRPVVENGRKSGSCQTPPKPVSDLQVTACNPEVKEHRTNGFVDSQEHKSHSPVSSVKVKENGEASSKKRPHSDLKYLDQMLNVPNREELHDVDDDGEQEWLFGQSGVRLSKKPQRRDSSISLDENPQVWNQAFRIESADIVALPYSRCSLASVQEKVAASLRIAYGDTELMMELSKLKWGFRLNSSVAFISLYGRKLRKKFIFFDSRDRIYSHSIGKRPTCWSAAADKTTLRFRRTSAMSRCFPFPPPGYEKKIRNDDADSLTKEKQKKEKKHKRDKKDKEKKEGKEKKDKETSKDKQKERKEKKEKHKDRKDKDRDKEKSRTSEDKRNVGVGDREKLVTNTLQSNGNGESKFIQDLARRIRDEEATESRSPRKIDLPCGVAENNISCSFPQTNHTRVNEKRIDTHRDFAMEKKPENAVRRLSSCTDQKGAEDKVKKPVEKQDQSKNHGRESVTKSDKPLDSEGLKKSEPKFTTHRSSQEKKEDKTEVIHRTSQEKLNCVEGGHRLKERDAETRNLKVQDLSKPSVKNLTAEGIIGKRKDLEPNGLLYENGSRPKKIQKPVASPISSVENGRNLGSCQTPPKPVSELQGTLRNPEVKEHKINGFIDSQEAKSRPTISSVKVKENGETSAKKRPHSDLKYLDQILNVPNREELHEIDDDEQEWLFGQSGVKLLKKQRTDSTPTSVDDTLQVWNQALRIESADTIALPYVVPF
ncbi:unnamed protein product [Thlaspi arvense]|uniref:Uncharacterized protein n=1 Tax=Thlaspi arvense TaxID=13288 RepID=A0AAU9S4J4_THLAR|nr:unnamed protein product [Thlaspi arvense]